MCKPLLDQPCQTSKSVCFGWGESEATAAAAERMKNESVAKGSLENEEGLPGQSFKVTWLEYLKSKIITSEIPMSPWTLGLPHEQTYDCAMIFVKSQSKA